MAIIVTILIFMAVLAVLILVHELGHFITARASGVMVEEFGFGFPPRIVGIKRGETTYSINSIPLGGFVKLAGEEDPSVLRSLASKSAATRLLILSAGSIMNALLPIVLLSTALVVPHDVVLQKVNIKEVAAGSPAEKAGLQVGDAILSINGKTLRNAGELSYNIQLNLGSPVTLGIQRGNLPPQNVTAVPRWNHPANQGAIGILLQNTDMGTTRETLPVWRAVPGGVRSTWEAFVLFKNEVLSWIIQRVSPQLAGPVAIAVMTGEVAKRGLANILSFTAFLSINLAIVNILPLPALDGGRIAFVLLELVRRGKKISPKREGLVHAIGFAMLMAVFVVITYYDILHIIQERG